MLNDRFIEVRNTSTYPPQDKNPKREVHDDIGYISVDGARKRLVLRQFHIEGFVNQYVEEASAAVGTLSFTSKRSRTFRPDSAPAKRTSCVMPMSSKRSVAVARRGSGGSLRPRAALLDALEQAIAEPPAEQRDVFVAHELGGRRP